MRRRSWKWLPNQTGQERRNASQGVYPKLEEALVVWLSAMIANKITVSGDILKQKPEVFVLQIGMKDFKFSNEWLHHLKIRNYLKFKKMWGESSTVDDFIVTEYRDEKLQSLLQRFPPDDIFNCDKTRLFYKLLPEKTRAFVEDHCHGSKHSKERLTVLVGSNMSGSEKLPLLVISASKHPRCFKGAVTVPVPYEANKKAWVMQQLFEAYVCKLDRKFEQQNRRVLLFVDNSDGPRRGSELEASLQIRMVLCSDNRTSYTVYLRSAVSMLEESWKAVTQETLRNCFRHVGFTLDAQMAVSPQMDSVCDELPSTDVAFDDLRTAGVSIPARITFEGFADADKDLELCANLTNDEIIRQVLEDYDDIENKEPSPTQPMSSEFARAQMTLSSVYSGNMMLTEIEADMIAGKRNVGQKKIGDFFAPEC
nr:tigger transposable element-derived protein 4-like [Rhipicephalus microplus]